MTVTPGSATQPAILPDGTLRAVVESASRVELGNLWLSLLLPKRMEVEQPAGRFMLARCGAQSEQERGEQWSIYLRRPLFVAAQPRPLLQEPYSLWRLAARADGDPGYAWLAQRQAGETINLAGPYGNGFPLQPLTRRLLVLADAAHLGLVTPLVDAMLDRGGQVSLLYVDDGAHAVDVDLLRAGLPLAVEFHRLAPAAWTGEIDQSLRWSDQLAAAVGAAHLPPLAEAVRRTHLRFEAGYAFAFVDADFACGYGACLACVVPLANGSLTRACVHGPVFDLLELAGKG